QFEQDKESLEKVKVSHILVEARKSEASEEELTNAKNKAKNIIGELNEGADFAKLAQKYSDDPGTKELGGLLDMEFSPSSLELVPEFVTGAFELSKVGEYSHEPVQTDIGYHIIKLDAKKSSFEEVKEDVKKYLAQEEKNTVFQDFMDNFRENSQITSNLFEDKNEKDNEKN
ncbi:MAG: peptidylprolyl isomerase, partial [Desulfitobacteriaceae bacterium]|nr:peptidylprolyl isomerase [Desulfitobacteriaceae bacterium]